jgi:hypothetical protein
MIAPLIEIMIFLSMNARPIQTAQNNTPTSSGVAKTFLLISVDLLFATLHRP